MTEYDEVTVPDSLPGEAEIHACIDCGTPVPPTKSGRQFDRCIDCRRAARAASSGSVPKTTASRNNWEAPLAAQLTEMVQGIGVAVALFDKYDGMVIMQGGERLGNALIGPARTNRKVRTALENAVQGGAWAGVVMATAAILVPILAHHKMIPGMPIPTSPAPAGPSKGNEGHISV